MSVGARATRGPQNNKSRVSASRLSDVPHDANKVTTRREVTLFTKPKHKRGRTGEKRRRRQQEQEEEEEGEGTERRQSANGVTSTHHTEETFDQQAALSLCEAKAPERWRHIKTHLHSASSVTLQVHRSAGVQK
ncbi:hypothetical protein F2P81_009659 [Scophthalmus maximus]|uniref:Uncharacterized protein n=1 Tax=Scophthalmus maximus TaxID=52904 RepID=A0A6A4T260_SCOMX|nr:hypothetical protein F2P81_009659 [Scophthalmus maximus]